MYNNNNQPNQFLRFLAAVIATADDQKPHSRQQRIRLKRLHNDPKHLKEMRELKGRYRCGKRRYTEEDEDPRMM